MRSLNQSNPIRLTPLSTTILLVFVFRGLLTVSKPTPKPTSKPHSQPQQTATLWHSVGLCMGAGIPKLHKLLYGAGWWHSGHPMVWDYPQFPHRAEPKALNLLQTGTLCESLIGLLSYPILSNSHLCATLGHSVGGYGTDLKGEHKCFRSFILYHHKRLVF